MCPVIVKMVTHTLPVLGEGRGRGIFFVIMHSCVTSSVCGGGGGFSSCARVLGECSTVNSPPAPVLFFFLKWKSGHIH